MLKNLINVYKYESVRAVSLVLAEKLRRMVGDFNGVIVPLPTIGKHIRERGFDHMALLAQKTGWKVEKVLKRVNNTVQVGASADRRKKQAAMAYAIAATIKPENEYLLLDDV